MTITSAKSGRQKPTEHLRDGYTGTGSGGQKAIHLELMGLTQREEEGNGICLWGHGPDPEGLLSTVGA